MVKEPTEIQDFLFKMRPVIHLAAGQWGVRDGGGEEDCKQEDQEDLHLVQAQENCTVEQSSVPFIC